MGKVHCAALIALLGISLTSLGSDPRPQKQPATYRDSSSVRQLISGPTEPLNQAVAAGATAIVTLQPVAPKTVPASNYPPGSAIMGQTLTLGSVPARVWLEVQVTGWAPEDMKLAAIAIDATDEQGDGGGYDGDNAECQGAPMLGAGDLLPAMQACSGTCSTDGRICATGSECRFCTGGMNAGIVCTSSGDCPGGSCPPFTGITCNGANNACRANMSGIASACGSGEPARCSKWDGASPGNYFPPGRWCEPAFQNKCHPQWIGTGTANTAAVDISTLNVRAADLGEPGEALIDFHPSYLLDLPLDVPANAKGTYRVDFNPQQTFLQNFNDPPGNNIPIAALVSAEIRTTCGSCCTDFSGQNATCIEGLSEAECEAMPSTNARVYRAGTLCDQAPCCDCTMAMDCQDNDVCTVDACVDSCYCTNTPVAGWNPATECCHPMTGAQGMIPQSTPCRTGTCSLGGSSGVPTYTQVANGTSCSSIDPCTGDGTCQDGGCEGDAYAGQDCPKSRFISFDASAGSGTKAYRIRLASLHHPDPPYTGAPTVDFSMHEGEVRWVGQPQQYIESSADFTAVYASIAQCQPHYQNWLGLDPLHVTGGEIVPSSVYEVQSIALGLDINNEANYSAPITIATARWGESVIPYAPPATVVQPDASDISEILDKFRSATEPVSKPRALLTGPGMAGIPDLDFDVSFSDVAACVDANKGKGYPYPWPAECP